LKKIILFLLLVSSLFGEAKVYLGSNYGSYEENFTNEIDAQSSTQVIGIKAGYGVREAYAVEIDLEYIDTQSKIFSSTPSSVSDGKKYGMNINFLKAFDFGIYILPYLKVGVGAGTMNIERTLQNRLYYGSYNVGSGIFIPLGDSYDLELGYNYKYTTYKSIETIAEKIMYESHVNIAYLGINVRF